MRTHMSIYIHMYTLELGPPMPSRLFVFCKHEVILKLFTRKDVKNKQQMQYRYFSQNPSMA